MGSRSLTPSLITMWGGLAAYHICRVVTAISFPTRGGPAPFSYQPGHWRFSLLRALNKDGSGQWSGDSQPAQHKSCASG